MEFHFVAEAQLGVYVGVAFAIAGAATSFTPAESLLRLDRRLGLRVYDSMLRSTGDERRARGRTLWFYRIAGATCVVVGGLTVGGTLTTAW